MFSDLFETPPLSSMELGALRRLLIIFRKRESSYTATLNCYEFTNAERKALERVRQKMCKPARSRT